MDNNSVAVILAGQVIVVAVLFLLHKSYKYARSFLFKLVTNRKKIIKTSKPEEAVKAELENDVNAAIAMALYLYITELHDQESNVITIQRVSKTYSPWSSKIYSMRNLR